MSGNEHRILWVGDDPAGATVSGLEAAGFEVTTVADAERVRGIAVEEPIECVICSSARFAETERDLREAIADVDGRPPIVVLTGDADPDTDPDPDDERAEATAAGETRTPHSDGGDGRYLADLVSAVETATTQDLDDRDPRHVVESSPVGQCLVSDGQITYTNLALAELLDTTRDALEGTPVADLASDDDRERVTEWLEAAVDGNEHRGRFRVRSEFSPLTERLVVDSSWAPANGATDTAVATLVDVTDWAAREAELERESEMLRSLMENVPMSIYFKDRLSRHERVSHHMLCQDPDSFITNQEGKAHAHPDDIVGKTDFDLYAPSFAEEAVADDRRIMTGEEPVVDEIAESTTNLGETIFTSTTKAPRYDEDGNVIGLVGVTMDVTGRESYKRELERQNERLNEFTEVLSHDLRSPLTVAHGYLTMLEDTCDEPYVADCLDALDRMDRIIDEIRTFVLEGRTVDDPDDVDLDRAAREAWRCADTGDATLETESDLTIRADADRLQRVFENLYRNSVEHSSTSSRGGPDDSVKHSSTSSRERPDVTVTVGRLDDGSGFFVADDGSGIPEEHRDRVFERGFTTGDDTTGFGLAIVANIAGAHDWTVSVTESVDGGARFEFTDVVRVGETTGKTHS